jgi:heme-degrading monooxygenase HmoA
VALTSSDEVQMIIREWRGRAQATTASGYPKHFRRHVLPELERIKGFVGAHLSQRKLGDKVEFLVLTRWASMKAIRAFAGAELDKAVVEPEAVAALVEYDLPCSALRRTPGSVNLLGSWHTG